MSWRDVLEENQLAKKLGRPGGVEIRVGARPECAKQCQGVEGEDGEHQSHGM